MARISFYHVGVLDRYEMAHFLESGPKMNLDKAMAALRALEESERARLYHFERFTIVRAGRDVKPGKRVVSAARV